MVPPHDAPPARAPEVAAALPTPTQQSWGTVISIILIVMMIIVGALYTWGRRIAAERAALEEFNATTSTSLL